MGRETTSLQQGTLDWCLLLLPSPVASPHNQHGHPSGAALTGPEQLGKEGLMCGSLEMDLGGREDWPREGR